MPERINGSELGDFDAPVLGLLLMAHPKRQIVVPDLLLWSKMSCSLHKRESSHCRREPLGELPVILRQSALLIEAKEVSGATMQDAETLAEYAGFVKGTQGFTDYVQSAVH